MEFLTFLLSSLLAVVSPAGIVIDTAIEKGIRSNLASVEQLQVRIDNAPSYHLVQGKVERVRIAGRGLWLTPDVRVDTLELETDPIDVDPSRLLVGGDRQPVEGLRRSLQAGLRVVFTEEDINQALRSPYFTNYLQNLALGLFGSPSLQEAAQRYQIVNPQIEFLDNNRFRFQLELEERGYSDRLKLTVDSGLNVVAGHQFQLISPAVQVNDRPAPAQLVKGLIRAAGKFDLQRLQQAQGLTARILQLNLNPEQVEVALFVGLQTQPVASKLSSPLSATNNPTSKPPF